MLIWPGDHDDQCTVALLPGPATTENNIDSCIYTVVSGMLRLVSNLTLSFAVCLPCLTGATHSSLRQLHSFPLTWPAVDTRSENYAETPVTLCQAICARHSSVHETPDKWQRRLTWDDPRWCRVAQMAWCWSTGMKASGRSHVILSFSSLIVHSCKLWEKVLSLGKSARAVEDQYESNQAVFAFANQLHRVLFTLLAYQIYQ